MFKIRGWERYQFLIDYSNRQARHIASEAVIRIVAHFPLRILSWQLLRECLLSRLDCHISVDDRPFTKFDKKMRA